MTAAAAPHGISQGPDEPFGVHSDGGEHHERKAGEDAPAERDEHVVDRQLAREPDEVHASPVSEPAASDVGDTDGQPQRDWQMQNGQHFSVAARPEWEHVGEKCPGREEQREPEAACKARLALPHEVDGEQREDEQAGVPGVERRQFLIRAEVNTEQRGHLDGQGGGDGEAQDDQCLRACVRPRLIGRVGSDDQLLPQPLGVLACELAGERVETPHALDRHQESFVRRQASTGEHQHLVAQVPLQFLHVGAVDSPTPTQVAPPLRDLLLERWVIGGGRHAVRTLSQMPLRVSSTTCHCFRCASS